METPKQMSLFDEEAEQKTSPTYTDDPWENFRNSPLWDLVPDKPAEKGMEIDYRKTAKYYVHKNNH